MIKTSLASLAVAALLSAGSVQAQTCTPSAGAIGTGTVSIDTCNSTNQLLSVCNGLDSIGASPDTVYSLVVGPGMVGSISAAPTGYDLKLALLSGSCSAASTCIRDADAGGVGGAESFGLDGLALGTYYVFLTSFGGTPNCGPTSISAIIVPVTLQQFSVD
ncbi:MAG: hypothetical protein JNN30_12145 [Rhodanobacteraceae bacterium]|nr:hypothetical protein [Rhodanobacteraceae bacterium]